jgi:glycosyltransferase involved in cell wall biosynthesis
VTRRILHIVPSLARCGASRLALAVARGLPRDEFESHVCGLADGDGVADFSAAGVPATSVDRRWPLDAHAAWRLRRCVRRLRPDVVHAWTPPATAFAWAAGARPLVATYRLGHEPAPHGWLERIVSRRAARIIVATRSERETLERHGLPRQRCEVIPLGINVPAADAATPAAGDLRAALAIPSDVRLIAAVGPLATHRRLKDLIWAADILKCVRQDFRLLIVGGGPQRARLEQYRAAVRIDDLVLFTGPRSDIQRLLAACDVYWAAGAEMSHSLALLEAMAAGLPAVAADTSGHRELIVPGETGFLVPLGSRPSYARHTLEMFEQPVLLARLGQGARQRAAREFPLSNMLARYADLYREVSQAGPRG